MTQLKILATSLLLLAANFASAGIRPPETGETAAETAPVVKVLGDEAKAAQAWNLIEQGALLIDVRRPGEYAWGHIEGAINIVHTDTDGLVEAIGDDKKRSVVVYCKSGRRSGLAKQALESLGYEEVFNATGFTALRATRP